MSPSLPLMFGAILAGGLVIDYGVKNAKAAFNSSPTAAAAGGSSTATGSVMSAEQLAQSLIGSPYNVGGHATAISSTVAAVKKIGTDCSGFVSDLMGPNGLGVWSSAYATPGIPTAPDIQAGAGKQVTLWNNADPGSSGHVFVQFNLGNGLSRYFEDAGGTGVHEMTSAEVASYTATGQYQPFHPAGY